LLSRHQQISPYAADAADAASTVDTTSTDAADDAVVVSPDEGPAYPPENCRWLGYGIGRPGQGQCDTNNHLLAHSALQCGTVGGEPMNGDREVVGLCATGKEEVQVYCCFAGGVPALDTAASDLGSHLLPGSASATRDDLIAGAVASCEADGARLGDWSVFYQQDAVSPAELWFSCIAALAD
jgi:hypothetical protein